MSQPVVGSSSLWSCSGHAADARAYCWEHAHSGTDHRNGLTGKVVLMPRTSSSLCCYPWIKENVNLNGCRSLQTRFVPSITFICVFENVIRAWRAYSRWCARQSQHLWLVGMARVFRMPAFQCIATYTLEFCISGRTQRNRRGHRGTYQWKRKQQLPILCLLDVCTKSQHLFTNKRLNDVGRFNVAIFLVWPLEKRNSNDCFFLRFALASKKRKKSWLFTLALLL